VHRVPVLVALSPRVEAGYITCHGICGGAVDGGGGRGDRPESVAGGDTEEGQVSAGLDELRSVRRIEEHLASGRSQAQCDGHACCSGYGLGAGHTLKLSAFGE
jgi:hypothetical protein